MPHILLFGAGKSASALIDFLKNACQSWSWNCTVVDAQPTMLDMKLKDAPTGMKGLVGSVDDTSFLKPLVASADVVISLMPPTLHLHIALACLDAGKHLLTASYIDPKLKALEKDIEAKNLIFLAEMGLDPGIDHMSAMDMIRRIQTNGGKITGFYSHCGGLVAPESDNNPWHYKISWNPRNVVLAGQAGAVFLKDGRQVDVPYAEMFSNAGSIQLKDGSTWGFYPNRDSLSYISLYGLESASTFIRTTLRHPSFLEGWNSLVRMGLTKDELIKQNPVSYADFFQQSSVAQLPDTVQYMLHWLGMHDHESVFKKSGKTYADLLQEILEEKWKLDPNDKDMIIMQHQIQYLKDGKQCEQVAELVVQGKDAQHTAMSMTVGLPLGIAAKCIVDKTWNFSGLHIPIQPAIYEPVLCELKNYGIEFVEYVREQTI